MERKEEERIYEESMAREEIGSEEAKFEIRGGKLKDQKQSRENFQRGRREEQTSQRLEMENKNKKPNRPRKERATWWGGLGRRLSEHDYFFYLLYFAICFNSLLPTVPHSRRSFLFLALPFASRHLVSAACCRRFVVLATELGKSEGALNEKIKAGRVGGARRLICTI